MFKKLKLFIALIAVMLIAVVAVNVNISSKSNKSIYSNLLLANIEALAIPDVGGPDCPNGCIEWGDGCWCKAWYPCYAEYNWGK